MITTLHVMPGSSKLFPTAGSSEYADSMTVINVRGSATEDVDPDFASIACSASATAPTASVAQQEASAIAESMRSAVSAADGVRSMTLSRVTVHEVTRWNESTRESERTGWQATISGRCDVEAPNAGDVAGVLIEAGAELGYLSWNLNVDNPAQRRVRTAAVADARRAADDFAAAVGGTLGELLSLADPGLLGGGPGDASPRMASAGMAMDAFTAKASPVTLDPGSVTVVAAVEASYSLAES